MSPAEREADALGLDMEKLRALAPGFAAAVERLGLRAAVERRLPYVLTSPRLRADLRRKPRP